MPIYNDILTEKPFNTIIGYSIDNFFLEKYYDITSPSWIPVQINEAKFYIFDISQSYFRFFT